MRVANHLFYGDNLDVLREHVPDGSVDLVYLDPPFNSNASYNILFKSPAGSGADAQIEAFEDTWHWNDAAEDAFDQVMRSGNTRAFDLVNSMRAFLGNNDMMAYLAMMAIRLIDLHRVLKPTGSLYLHCDPTASHYLKLLLDGVFGADKFRSEISWKRSTAHNDARQGRRQYGNVRDVILFYTKSHDWTWNWQYSDYSEGYIKAFYKNVDSRGRRFQLDNLTAAKPGGDTRYEWRALRRAGGAWETDFDNEFERPRPDTDYIGTKPYAGRIWAYSRENMLKLAREDRIGYTSTGTPRFKRFLDEMPGVPLQNDWGDIAPASGHERLGYPTQKPVALLERIIAASSNPDDVVLDPFCGCGTAVHAAQKLQRQWIGIDVTHLAISLIERRLRAAFPGIAFTVEGTPKDLASAEDLARRDKYQFQWWAISMVDAMPQGGRKKKGPDGGIDGIIYFRPDGRKTEKALVSVKGGAHVSVQMIRDLHSAMEREKAPIGVFLTKTPPTRAMEKEAAAVGRFVSGTTGRRHARLQIITLADLFAGKRPDIPMIDPGAAFRKAAREERYDQARLL